MSEPSNKQGLSEKERRLVAFCEQEWFLRGHLPTPETLQNKFNYTARDLKRTLDSELIKKSFDSRGIPTIEGRELSPEQLTVINDIINPNDTRSERKILADAGISAKTFAGWRRDPVVQQYMLARTEQILGGAIPDAHLALVEKVRSGDMSALKFYYEVTGRYTGQNAGLDPRALLEKVFGIIAKYVDDPQALIGISTEFMALTGIDGGDKVNSGAPVAGVVVHSELEGL
jgi:hypothetical protein